MFKAEGFSFLQQMGMAHALITGSSLDGAAVTKRIKIQLLRGACLTEDLDYTSSHSATGNRGVLPNTLGEIWALISEPAVRVVNENHLTKLRTYLMCDEETNVE